MQDLDGLLELVDVHNAVNATCLHDLNLSCARMHIAEGFPVSRFKPGLDYSFLGERMVSEYTVPAILSLDKMSH